MGRDRFFMFSKKKVVSPAGSAKRYYLLKGEKMGVLKQKLEAIKQDLSLVKVVDIIGEILDIVEKKSAPKTEKKSRKKSK